MKNIILAEDNPKIMTLLKDAFLTVWDHEILEVENGVEAIDILQEKPEEISLVISDYSMPHMNGIDVYQWIKQNSPKTPFFLLNGGEIPDPESFNDHQEINPLNRLFNKINDLPKILDAIKNIDNVDNEEVNNVHYSPFPLKQLYKIQKTPVDIYIKLSSQKYVKIINNDDEIKLNFLQDYIKKGVIDIFTVKSDYSPLLDSYLKTLNEKLNSKSRPESAKKRDRNEALSIVHHKISEINLSESTIILAKEMLQNTLKTIDDTPELSEILGTIVNEEDYLFEHSVAISHLANAICAYTSWNSKENYRKLTIASLFHDSSLPELSMSGWETSSWTDIENSDLSSKEKNALFIHPAESVKHISKMGCIDSDVFRIIQEHHEKPDGSGFPKGLTTASIPPLSAIFIVAEDFIDQFYRKKYSPELLDKILDRMEIKYQKSHFKKAYEGLVKAIG